MLIPKKTIPSLAAATLALTGLGCGDTTDSGTGGTSATGGTSGTGGASGVGGSSGGDLANAISQFCMRRVECMLDEDLQYCISVYEYLFSDGDAACQAAAISYFECGLALPCDQIGLDSNACDPEFNNADDVCFN